MLHLLLVPLLFPFFSFKGKEKGKRSLQSYSIHHQRRIKSFLSGVDEGNAVIVGVSSLLPFFLLLERKKEERERQRVFSLGGFLSPPAVRTLSFSLSFFPFLFKEKMERRREKSHQESRFLDFISRPSLMALKRIHLADKPLVTSSTYSYGH